MTSPPPAPPASGRGDPSTIRRLYGRAKGHKLRQGQAALVEELLPALSVPAEGEITAARLFGDDRPLHFEIGFGADEAVVGQQVGAIGEMLAAAEADLEMERPRIAEQELGGDRPLFGYRYRRKELLEQRGLSLAKLVARAAAVKAAKSGGVVHGAADSKPLPRRGG